MRVGDFMEQYSALLCKSNYGSLMFESSLADWLEFAALKGVNSSWSTISDAWKDVGLTQIGKSGMIEMGSDSAQELDYYDLAHEEIEWRQRYLRELYPFELNRFGSLVVRRGFGIANSVYIDLLLLSLLKGFAYYQDASILQPLSHYFELLVETCLKTGFESKANLFRSGVMGTSAGGSFEERLGAVAKKLGLVANPTAAPRPQNAQDEGADVLWGITWRDERKSDMLCVVQATIAESTKWREKLDRIHTRKWAAYFDEWTEPRALLAIPYRMTDAAALRTIDSLGGWSYLDRARLTQIAGGNLALDGERASSLRTELLDLADSRLGIRVAP